MWQLCHRISSAKDLKEGRERGGKFVTWLTRWFSFVGVKLKMINWTSLWTSYDGMLLMVQISQHCPSRRIKSRRKGNLYIGIHKIVLRLERLTCGGMFDWCQSLNPGQPKLSLRMLVSSWVQFVEGRNPMKWKFRSRENGHLWFQF